jgi:maltooligosyltrehalose trehalohydrolase
MHEFNIWAPNAQRLQVSVDGTSHPMQSQRDDYWSAIVPEAGHGSDYAFLINDDPHPYPDPRSLWQPHGVHAASRVYDHSLFQWSTPAAWSATPLADAVVYELHIGTFTPEGTFDAAIAHLPYLKELGITHVEIMPVASFPGRWGWGYDGVALYAPQESYGGPDGLKRLVDACHGAGLAAVLDVVYNHFGPVGNYSGVFGNYILHEYATPWGGVVNLDSEGSAQVRRFFIDNALMWLRDYRFDALRLDAIHALHDKSPIHFLADLSAEVAALAQQTGRPLHLIAESDLNDPIVITQRESGGYGMDAQWSDDFHHALHAVLTGERRGYYADFGSLQQLAKSLRTAYVYDGQHSPSRNHSHGRSIGNNPGSRFLGYIQNHDQVGNRALGDRIHRIAGSAAARVAAALVLTSPFVPLIFQGEEFAASTPFLYFADHEEESMRTAVSEGRRREFAGFEWPSEIPDPEDPQTFTNSKLNWQELQSGEHRAMLDWYRQLLALRHEHPALHPTDLSRVQTSFDEERRWLVITRENIQVVCNFASESQTIPIAGEPLILAASETGVKVQAGSVHLPQMTVAILATRCHSLSGPILNRSTDSNTP